MSFLITGLLAFGFYLILTAGSGTILGGWSAAELIAGAVTALIVAAASSRLLGQRCGAGALNPLRWVLAFIYVIGPLFWGMAKANLDVARRVITGEIRPGIVKVKAGLAEDLGVTMLANSITLTPGTLTVDIDDESHDLYIHWIDVKTDSPSIEDISGGFSGWIRRITE